jgi:aminopeptidase N
MAVCVSLAQGPVRQAAPPAQAIRQPGFRAVSYDVSASLLPGSQSLSAKATVEFEARELSRTVDFELHPNLRITSVTDAAGTMLSHDRDSLNPFGVRVSLPDNVEAGQRTKLTVEYSGPFSNAQSSLVQGLRMAWIGADGAYLLLPARWFPLTDYPANRYTGTFRLEVPQQFVVAGTGMSSGPAPVVAPAPAAPAPALGNANPAGTASRTPAAPSLGNANPAGTTPPASVATASGEPRVMYTFQVDRPQAAGTFVAGALQLSSVRSEGLNIAVYTPAASAATAQAYGDAVAGAMGVYSDQFAPLPEPNLTVAQIPDGTLPAFAAPGLLLISQRQWQSTPNTRLISNGVASQWWGDQVMAASPSDAWLTAGLARYSEAIYIEQTAGKEGMNRALEDFAVGALMFEDAAPIGEAGRLEPFTPAYNSVVVNKGAMVFHMLRGQVGDAAFFSLLRDLASQYRGKQVAIADFQRMAEARTGQQSSAAPSSEFVLRGESNSQPAPSAQGSAPAPSVGPNLRAFFAQWIYSTGVPEFSLTYTVYRTKTGFRLVGKVRQNLDFFRMPVEFQVQTEGNPEIRTVEVAGTESNFDFEVFGRPRSNSVTLDPNNYILKSSPRLRVRSIIARGEALAEEGRYYDAIQQYSQALDVERNNALAAFRMGEAFFYQRNYSAAANSFRDTLDGEQDQSYRWVEVWAHIYLGKIYDISGDRARAVNEYSKAEQTNDNTGGALDEARKYISQPYMEGSA